MQAGPGDSFRGRPTPIGSWEKSSDFQRPDTPKSRAVWQAAGIFIKRANSPSAVCAAAVFCLVGDVPLVELAAAPAGCCGGGDCGGVSCGRETVEFWPSARCAGVVCCADGDCRA